MAQQCAQLEETRAGPDGPDRPVRHEQEERIHENMDCELSEDAPVQENSETVSNIASFLDIFMNYFCTGIALSDGNPLVSESPCCHPM